VAILARDLGDKFRQFVRLPGRTQNYGSVAIESQLHTISLSEAGLFRDRKRDTDGQAVPPFRDSGFISHMYLL
jgi:hypothetical protein